MYRSLLYLSTLALVTACDVAEEVPTSKSSDQSHEFDIPVPDVSTGWPCHPFMDVETDEKGNLDDDGDGLTNCVEEYWGLNPNDPDTDGDTVEDRFDLGDIEDPFDTDDDKILDALDDDDDGDGILMADEDVDGDGLSLIHI